MPQGKSKLKSKVEKKSKLHRTKKTAQKKGAFDIAPKKNRFKDAYSYQKTFDKMMTNTIEREATSQAVSKGTKEFNVVRPDSSMKDIRGKHKKSKRTQGN